MTDEPIPPSRSGTDGYRALVRSKDPDLLVVKRSVRAAVVMPSVFAITHALFSDPQVALFAAFGSFALLLLVEFTGRPATRLVSYGGLFVVGACFTVLGTVVSTHKVAAVVTMALVGFAVLFAGIVAPQAATASTAALLTFVLPVAVAQPASAVGPRLVGWALAAALLHHGLPAGLAAALARQPAPPTGRRPCRPSRACADARARGDGATRRGTRPCRRRAGATARRSSRGRPTRLTGAASGAVALSKLVGRVEWVAGNAAP